MHFGYHGLPLNYVRPINRSAKQNGNGSRIDDLKAKNNNSLNEKFFNKATFTFEKYLYGIYH